MTQLPTAFPLFKSKLSTSGNSYVIHIPKKLVRRYALQRGKIYEISLCIIEPSEEKFTTFKKQKESEN